MLIMEAIEFDLPLTRMLHGAVPLRPRRVQRLGRVKSAVDRFPSMQSGFFERASRRIV
jgi:hypothetical protein